MIVKRLNCENLFQLIPIILSKFFYELIKQYDLEQFFCNQGSNTEIASNEINAREGILLSPNHPNDYENGLECGWDIKLPHGTRMSLKLIHVKIKFLI